MKKKTLLLTEEDLKDIEMFEMLSYDDLNEYLEKRQLLESKQTIPQELDITYEEFIKTYDAVDLSDFFASLGLKLDET